MGAVTTTEPSMVDVSVSPNPTASELTISFGRLPTIATEIALLNAAGQVVGRKLATTGRETLNVAALPAGVYFLRISNAGENQTKKVLITR
jgi:hypothetical protein